MLPRDENGEHSRKSSIDGNFAVVEINRNVASADAVTETHEKFSVTGDGSIHGPVQASSEKPTDWNDRAVTNARLGSMIINELAQSWGVPLQQ